MEEIEAKFILESAQDVDAALRLLAAHATLHALDRVRNEDIYLDDRRGRLRQAGWSCRVRVREPGGDACLQMKRLDGQHAAVHVREEIEQHLFLLPHFPLAVLELDEGPVRDALADIGCGRLRQQFVLDTARRRYRAVTPEHVELEVCADRSAVVAGQRGVLGRFDELELELVSGSRQALDRLSKTLVEMGFRGSRLSKFERGAWACGVSRPAKPEGLTPASSSTDLLGVQIGRWMTRLAHYGWLAAEGVDPQGVHLLRTNIRRIRSALKSATPEVADAAGQFSLTLAELARGVGPVRDLDVFKGRVALCLDGMDDVDDRARALLLARLLAGRQGARAQADRALASLPSVLEEWQRLAGRLEGLEGPTVERFSGNTVLRAWRRLRKSGRSLTPTSPEGDLHDVRLRAKRLRYALELVSPAYGGEAKGYVRLVRHLQDAFGAHQDACVAVGILTRVAREMPADGASRDALVLLGRVLQHHYERRAASREEALRAWHTWDRLVRRRDLRKLLSGP